MNRYNKISSNEILSHLSPDRIRSEHFSVPLLCACVYVLNAILVLAFKTVSPSPMTAYTLMAVAEIMAVAVPSVVYMRITDKNHLQNAKGASPDKIAIILLCSATMTFGAMAISTLSTHIGLIEDSAATYNTLQLPALENRLAPMLHALVTFALIPAFCEELLCRCIIYSEYKKYGPLTAIAVSSLSFAMMHFSLGKFSMYLFCGVMLGFLRMLTGSAVASFFAHFFYNSFALFYYKFFGTLSEQLSEFTIVFFLLMFLCLLSLSLTFGEASRIFKGYAERSSLVISEKKESATTMQGLLQYLLSPALWLCFILYVIFSLVL